MSHRGRMKRAGRLNCALSFLLVVLVIWYITASVGSRATISASTALVAALCGATGGWIGWRKRKAHKRQAPLRQVRSTSAIATCLWFLEVILQLGSAMLEGGAIATMREEKKLNKHVITLGGICLTAACMIYSNARLFLTARRCGRWVEGRSRKRRHSNRGHADGATGTSSNPLH